MATASRDTTLTDLSGCLERTLDATSCTQMLSEMRWDMRTSNSMNSMIPDGSMASFLGAPPVMSPDFSLLRSFPEFEQARMISTYCARKALNVDGSAARSTDTANTMAMSSSSVKCASVAASSNSCAMPSETENARSAPSEPSAPTVAIQSTLVEASVPTRSCDTCNYSATSSQIRSTSADCCCLRPALACQQGLSLPIRHLLISPLVETKTNGRGGKSMRERVGSTHKHFYSGSIFGCLIGTVLDFVRLRDQRVSELMRTLCRCLSPAGKDVMLCEGLDAICIQRGFASHHVIRGQLPYLAESKRCSRIDSRYGKKSIVLGISVCVYFVLYFFATCDNNCSSVSFMARDWIQNCLHHLSMWKTHAQALGPYQYASLEAECRALRRADAAVRRATAESALKELDSMSAVKFELQCMRKAMWPAGRRIDADTQEELIEWISKGDFLSDVAIDRTPRTLMNFSVNLPLSAISLPGLTARGDSEDGSAWDTSSSIGSLSSVSSTGSAGNSDRIGVELSDAMSTLGDTVRV